MSVIAWQAVIAVGVIVAVCSIAAACVVWVSRHDIEHMDDNDRACRDE